MGKLIGTYKNGNYTVAIFDDGTKIRRTNDDEFIPSFSESIDFKITNYCDAGCAYCHENSTKNGLHGDIMNMKFIDTLHPYTEIACLSGDTIVYGKNGAVEIADLKVGDMIYDSTNTLRKISNINKEYKKVFKIKGKKGFKANCSEDHPFMNNGKMVQAKDMVGKRVDVLQSTTDSNSDEIVIDMAKYIKDRDYALKNSRGGRMLDENTVRLRNSTAQIPRYIKVDEDLMWLYGHFIAQGSRKGLSINIEETDYAKKIERIWRDKFGNSTSFYVDESKNVINVELQSASLVEDLFVKELKSGVGAKNKSLEYLFGLNDKQLIKSALLGLFDGDGCYRVRKNKSGENYIVSLKTSSKKLAYETSYLLAKWFGIYSSVNHGVNKIRKIEDRVLEPTEYYQLEIYNRDEINKLFYDRFDMVKRKGLSPRSRTMFDITEIEDTESYDYLYDITLDSGSHIFPINGYTLTHNCGGGDPLSHPDLIPFLKKLKSKSVIANITVNQKHFMQEQDTIKLLVDRGLISGLGVSLVDPNKEFIDTLVKYPNAVLHVINGVHSATDLNPLRGKGIKILILGYKVLRRGESFYDSFEDVIEQSKISIKEDLPNLINDFKVVSFDNLAIKQLGIKEFLTDEEWDEFYMGNDGFVTYFVDGVNEEFASSSTSMIRHKLLDSIDDMFDVIRIKK